jgi:hypothetical protein
MLDICSACGGHLIEIAVLNPAPMPASHSPATAHDQRVRHPWPRAIDRAADPQVSSPGSAAVPKKCYPLRGTEASNPSPSSEESCANQMSYSRFFCGPASGPAKRTLRLQPSEPQSQTAFGAASAIPGAASQPTPDPREYRGSALREIY